MLNKKKLVIRDGHVMAVIRPASPAMALADARTAARSEQTFDAMLTSQPYTFIGLATKKRKIVDPVTGKVIDQLQPGDSLVSHSQLVAHQRAQTTAKNPDEVEESDAKEE